MREMFTIRSTCIELIEIIAADSLRKTQFPFVFIIVNDYRIRVNYIWREFSLAFAQLYPIGGHNLLAVHRH